MEMECPICFEDHSEKIFVRLPCASMGHFLCMQCFIHLANRKCPLCRHPFDDKIPFIEDATRNNLITFLSIQAIPSRLRNSLQNSLTRASMNNNQGEIGESEDTPPQDENVVTTQLAVSREESNN